MRARDSRSLILRAARQEFAEHGYAGARMARVAQLAKVNKQLIFYYFKSKTGLYAAATQSAAPAESGMPGPDMPTEALRHVLNRLAKHLDDRPEVAMALSDREATLQAGGAAHEFVQAALGELTGVISRGQGMGYFRDDLDPRLAARQALALLTGVHAPVPGSPDGMDPTRWSAAASDLLLRAFTW
jgi:AcrR family transcriptional regulator